MAFADTQKLIVDLSLKGNFASSLASTQKSLAGFDRAISNTQGRAFKAGQQIGTGIKSGALIAAGAIGILATQVGLGLKSLSELESITAQTDAVLKSTGGVAGQTSKSIRDLAEKFEGLNATIDDKVIQSAENVLLTFTAVRKDAFEPAIQAALDMSTALGTDLQTATLQVGKALQDPERGITALRRAGVNFSKDQIKVIKALVDTGKTEEAQRLILAELNKEFGGSFLAGGATTQGKVAKFQDAIEDLQKALASALLPTIGKVADGLSKFLADPAVVRGVEDLGKSIAGLFSDANLKAGGDFLKGAFETAKSAAPVVAAGAKATFALVQGAVGLFKSLPPEIQKLAIGAFAVNKLTGGLVTNIAGGIIDVVGKNFLQRGGTPANPLFVADVSGGLGKGVGAIGAGTGIIGKASNIIGKVFIVGLAAEAASLIAGPLQEAAREIGKALPFGKERLSAGEALQDWIRTAPWPFGTKGQPDWAGGDPSKVNNIKGLSGGLSPEDRDILNDQRQKLQDIKDADQSTARSVSRTHGTVQQQLTAANKIYHSNLTNAQKIERLRAVQSAIGNRNINATRQVQQKIDAARRAQVAATARTTAVLKSKDFSVAIKNIINVAAKVSLKGTTTAQAIQNNYYNVPS